MTKGAVVTAADLAPRLRLVLMRLARRLRQETDGPVTPSQLSALHTIERLEPVTLGALAQAERVQPPSMTRIVAALEDRGYVARQVDAGDRRIARLRLTSEGRRSVERGRSRRTAYLAARLKALEPAELDALQRALPTLERILEDER